MQRCVQHTPGDVWHRPHTSAHTGEILMKLPSPPRVHPPPQGGNRHLAHEQ